MINIGDRVGRQKREKMKNEEISNKLPNRDRHILGYGRSLLQTDIPTLFAFLIVDAIKPTSIIAEIKDVIQKNSTD